MAGRRPPARSSGAEATPGAGDAAAVAGQAGSEGESS